MEKYTPVYIYVAFVVIMEHRDESLKKKKNKKKISTAMVLCTYPNISISNRRNYLCALITIETKARKMSN